MLLPTSMQVANNLLVATGSNNLVATRSICVTFLLDPTCFDLLYCSTMVVASNMLDFVSSGSHLPKRPLTKNRNFVRNRNFGSEKAYRENA